MSESKRSNRRDFLKGKSVREAIGAKIETPPAMPPAAQPEAASLNRQASYLEQYSKNAMACEFEISFNMQQYPNAGVAAKEGFQLLDELEDRLTVYRSHSEVSQINRLAASEAVTVEENLFQLLVESLEIHELTGGAFDITSGQLTKLWNFDRRAGGLPQKQEIEATLKKVGCRHVRLEPRSRTIRLDRTGVEINLGGIGKGHALDRMAGLFQEMGIEDYVIHGGQSSVLARGVSTTIDSADENDSTGGWTIGISHPTLPSLRLAKIHLRDRALGTSGTARQGFFHEGKRYGHIIDPRSGWPASHALSSTVITNSAARADALATAFYVMSPNEVGRFCQQHTEVGAVLILPSESAAKPTIRIYNLTDEDIELLDAADQANS
jgi:thiamine biosynthesis lipoprotein